MVFTLKINGIDFYSLEESFKGDDNEEKVYRIDTRHMKEGIIDQTFFDMRLNKKDETCVVSYDPRTCMLKCYFDKFEQSWNIPDVDDPDAFPIHFFHQKFEISVTIKYNPQDEKFKLDIDKKAFELLPYWVPQGGKLDLLSSFVVS